MKQPAPQTDWPLSWRQAYDYDVIEVFNPRGSSGGHTCAYQHRMARTLSMVAEVAPPGSKIIDIAAAQGNFCLSLAERGYDVTWNDLRHELAGYVRLKYEWGNVSYRPGDVFALCEPGSYDVVVITEIIEHVAHPDQFLRQIATLIRPGGFIIMTTPNGEYLANRLPKFSDCSDPSVFESVQFQPDGDGHIFLLHRDEIEPLANAAGLEVCSTHLFTSFLTAGRLGTDFLVRALPPRLLAALEEGAAHLPDPIARRVFVQLAVCFRRPATSHAMDARNEGEVSRRA